METSATEKVHNLLHGHAHGVAVALLHAPEGLAEAVAARLARVPACPAAFIEPCRVEHPHSAFLRKLVERDGKPGVRTTLWAPDGRLHEERLADGTALEHYVKKPADFQTLRGFLRDIEQLPALGLPEACLRIASLGRLPHAEMLSRWVGPELIEKAAADGNEALASCLRKLERQLKQRAEQAAALGCGCAVVGGVEDIPRAAHLLEQLRHIVPVYAEAEPDEALLAELARCHVGVKCHLAALPAELPTGLRLLVEATPAALAEPDALARLTAHAEQGSAVLLLDCTGAEPNGILPVLENALP